MTSLDLEDYYIPDIDELTQIVIDRRPKSILIEAPPGLKQYVLRLGHYLEKKTNSLLTYSMRYCWGLCDVDLYSLILKRYDLIIHLGHILTPNISNILRENIPTLKIHNIDNNKILMEIEDRTAIGWPIYRKVSMNIIELVSKTIEKNNINTILTIQQYLPLTEKASRRTRKTDIDILLITGCYIPKLHEDNKILVVSPGFFHAITPIIFGKNIDKIITIDPEQARDTTSECIKRFRYLLALKLSILETRTTVKNIGILISKKAGQRRPKNTYELYKTLRKYIENIYILEVDDITEDILRQVQVDYYINTACPRIAFDDIDRVRLPLLNMKEIDYILGKKRLSDYHIKALIEGY